MSVQSSTENNTRMIRNSEVKSEVTRKIVLRHNLRTVGTVGKKDKWTGSRNGINDV